MNAVFLDRDGTIIVEPPDGVIDSIDKIQLLPTTIDALKLLTSLNFSIVIVTNQPCIGEGRITSDEFEKINDEILTQIKTSGATVLHTYVCPHKPEDNCKCRKPKAGMLLNAAKDFEIDLSKSYMVGDRTKDVLAGKKAGTQTILVQTGNTQENGEEATYQAKDLLDAAYFISQHPL